MTSAEGGGGGNQKADESTDKLREHDSDKGGQQILRTSLRVITLQYLSLH